MTEMFQCITLGAKLTRKACGARAKRLRAGIGDTGRAAASVKLTTCGQCELGAAHDRGESPIEWPGGERVELVDIRVDRSRRLDDRPNTTPEVVGPPLPMALTVGRNPLKTKEASHMESDVAPKLAPRVAEDLGSILKGPPMRLKWRGRTLPIGRWVDHIECKVNGSTLRMRISSGWTVSDAIATPAGQDRPGRPAPEPEPTLDDLCPLEDAPKEEEADSEWREWARGVAKQSAESFEMGDVVLRKVLDGMTAGDQRAIGDFEADIEAWRTWAAVLVQSDGYSDTEARRRISDAVGRVERPPRHDRIEGRQGEVTLLLAWISGRLGVNGEAAAAAFVARVRDLEAQ